MRILPTEEHQNRKERILQAVIHLYIKTGKPVGSSNIVENVRLNLSPATVRNVLAELEKEGFLTHPHTSAGRTPTDKGYRFYVDSIVKIQRLAEEEEQRIRGEYERRKREIEELMTSTTRLLSSLTHCAGFALTPHFSEERLRLVELIPVSSAQVLGVLVSENGTVRHQMIKLQRVPDPDALRFASKFLTDQLRGFSFSQAEERLHLELERFQIQQSAQRDFLESLSQSLFEGGERSSLMVEGASNIFNFPEFRDLESVRHFAHLFDEKEALAKVLQREIPKEGLRVLIGEESAPELKDFSVISSCYSLRGQPLGMLGILGPKRMEYERMMAVVNTVAELVNRALEQNEETLLEG